MLNNPGIAILTGAQIQKRPSHYLLPRLWPHIQLEFWLYLDDFLPRLVDASEDHDLVRAKRERLLSHEVMESTRFISQLLDYCPGNTPKVSNWSRNSPLSGLMTNTFGVFFSMIQ